MVILLKKDRIFLLFFYEGKGIDDKQRHGEKLGGYLFEFWIFEMPDGINCVAGWRLGVEGEEWKRYGHGVYAIQFNFWTVHCVSKLSLLRLYMCVGKFPLYFLGVSKDHIFQFLPNQVTQKKEMKKKA